MGKVKKIQPTQSDNGDRPVQAPQEVLGPNSEDDTVANYPYVHGYACVPAPLYDALIENIFSQPYNTVSLLARHLENVSQITKIKKQQYESEHDEGVPS